MYYLAATLHTLGVRDCATPRIRKATKDPERGSVTIENVIWAVAVIAIVGIVVARDHQLRDAPRPQRSSSANRMRQAPQVSCSLTAVHRGRGNTSADRPRSRWCC